MYMYCIYIYVYIHTIFFSSNNFHSEIARKFYIETEKKYVLHVKMCIFIYLFVETMYL